MPVCDYTAYMAWCDECTWEDQGFDSAEAAEDALGLHLANWH